MEPSINEEKSIPLPFGLRFPAIGYGTYDLREKEATANAVVAALEAGYRLIDTAADYGNEEGIGEGLRRSAVPRPEVMVSSKVWPSELGYDKTMRAFEQSLSCLRLDYLDLYLIHWPCADDLNVSSWKALEQLKEEGLVRHIGVSNFTVAHLQSLAKAGNVPPLVNQVEFHPWFFDSALREFCQKEGILIEAWSPLMQGAAFSDEVLAGIGEKYGKSGAQVALRWCVQMGAVPLPKTKSPARMRENISIFDFELDTHDMAAIERIYTGKRSGPDPDNYHFCPQKPSA